MKKYRCLICGYIYDDSAESVKFEDLPEDWKCPICGATKDMFEEVGGEGNEEKTTNDEAEEDQLRELNVGELAYICSNLAKSCEKQYLFEEMEMFKKLYDYFISKLEIKDGNIDNVLDNVNNDIKLYDEAMNIADTFNDSGAKRVITWGSKTTNMIKSLLNRYQTGEIFNSKVWVCDICGFIYIGEEPPAFCPVCKVPNSKILEVK